MDGRIICTLILTTLFALYAAEDSCFVRMKGGKLVKYGKCEDSNGNRILQGVKAMANTEQRIIQDVPSRDESRQGPGQLNGCKSSVFEFPNKESPEYVQYRGTLPKMTSFTTCMWVRPHQGIKINGTLISYCTVGATNCNTIYVSFEDNDYISVGRKNQAAVNLAIGTTITSRSHVCIVVTSQTSKAHLYVNATEVSSVAAPSDVIPQGGVLILGQDQDGSIRGTAAGAPEQLGDSFRGIADSVTLWDRALPKTEITTLHLSGCNCANDATVHFNSTNSFLKGSHVTTSWDSPCAGL